MKRFVKRFFRDYLRKSGRELTFYPLHTYLRNYSIDCVLDVGANVGQYANEIRKFGYDGQIISFEPLTSAFEELKTRSSNDSHWSVHNYAFGDKDENLEINISKASSTSSFLPILNEGELDNTNITYVSSETVPVYRLDTRFDELTAGFNRTYLKIDTQGFEDPVLQGAVESLEKLTGVQIEVSLSKIYSGEVFIETIIDFMRKHGFTPYWIEQGYKHSASMKLMQADIYFFKDKPQ